MENEKGIVVRFVVGRRFSSFVIIFFLPIWCMLKKYMVVARAFYSDDTLFCSANRGDSLDKSIDSENRQHNDFIILVWH